MIKPQIPFMNEAKDNKNSFLTGTTISKAVMPMAIALLLMMRSSKIEHD